MSAAPVLSVVDGSAAREAVTAELAALIGSATFGSSGLRYRRLDVAGQLARLHDPVFVLARDAERPVGCCVLDRRALLVGGRETVGVYRGSLCVAPGRAGRGIGRALAEVARAWIDAEAARRGEPVLSWGCIERGNAPSLAVLGASGARDAGGLAMPMAYRQWPRERLAVERLAAGAGLARGVGAGGDAGGRGRAGRDAERAGRGSRRWTRTACACRRGWPRRATRSRRWGR